MRKNEKVMRFRSGEQVGQRFLVVSNPLFCSFKFVNAQQTPASFSWPVFSFGHRALGTQRATDGDITWKYSRGTWAPFSYKALLGPAQTFELGRKGPAKKADVAPWRAGYRPSGCAGENQPSKCTTVQKLCPLLGCFSVEFRRVEFC